MRFEMVRLDELGPAELTAWEDLRDADPALANPFFSAKFAQTINRHRRDIRTIILEDGRDMVGFLTLQRPTSHAGMTLAAPIGDYFGVIGGRSLDFDPRDLAKAARVGRIDFANSLASHGALRRLHRNESVILKTDLSDYDRLSARLKSSRNIKQSHKKENKLKNALGEVVFEAFHQDPADFKTLIQMKTEQYKRRGVPDILNRPWVAGALRDIFESSDPATRGYLFTLKAQDRLLAAIFAFASKTVLHPWFPAYDLDYARYSVGFIAWRKMVDAAYRAGFREIDMGPGDYAYKRVFANASAPVGQGYIPGRGWFSSSIRGLHWRIEEQAATVRTEAVSTFPGRARRWIDLRRGLNAKAA